VTCFTTQKNHGYEKKVLTW